MKATVVMEHLFVRSPDGSYWTRTNFAYSFWQRYLMVFDALSVVSRVEPCDAVQPGWNRVDGPGVVIGELPAWRGLSGYLRNHGTLTRLAQAAIHDDHAVIMRISSSITEAVEPRLRRTGHPFGVEVGSDPWEVFAPGLFRHPLRPLLRRYFRRMQIRQCASAAAACYVTQEALQRRYPAAVGAFSLGVSDVELHPDAFASNPRSARSGRPFRLVMVGSLAYLVKAPDLLIDAVAAAVARGLDLTLTLVGDGRFRASLEERAQRLGVGSRISFRGSLPAGAPVRTELDAADAFVLPSRSEGLPRALLEAMARGMPCLATRVGGIPELLHDEDLIAPGDSSALCAALIALAGDPARQLRSAARNLERARAYAEDRLQEQRNRFFRAVAEATSAWQRGLVDDR